MGVVNDRQGTALGRAAGSEKPLYCSGGRKWSVSEWQRGRQKLVFRLSPWLGSFVSLSQ